GVPVGVRFCHACHARRGPAGARPWSPAARRGFCPMARAGGAPSVPAMATIIVGVDDSPRSEDAIALAGTLARAAGADIVAVCAFPYDDRPEAHFNLALRPLLLERAESTLDRLCEPLNDDPHVRRLAVADLSP